MTASRRTWIGGPAGRLEGALREARQPLAVAVLSHPHPLYGGTMDNPVVFHADRELSRAGLTTVRFNFRGVGRSEGFHDDGRGEIDDVAAIAAWARSLAPGSPLLLVGYSFGARCALYAALGDGSVAGVAAIGLPVRLWDLSDALALGRPLAVVQGSLDEFGSPAEVEAFLGRARFPVRLAVVEGVGHLFPGRAPEAAARVVEAARWVLGAAAAAADHL